MQSSSINFYSRGGALFASNSLRTDEFRIKGLNWVRAGRPPFLPCSAFARRSCVPHLAQFGAEGKGACVDGLWQRPVSAYLDVAKSLGFNALRLPVAVDNVNSDPLLDKWSLTADPELRGLRSLDVLETVISQAAQRGLLVCLDMHRLHAAVWPTSHGLWYDPEGDAPSSTSTAATSHTATSTSDTISTSAAAAAAAAAAGELPLEAAWVKLARRFCSMWNVFLADIFVRAYSPIEDRAASAFAKSSPSPLLLSFSSPPLLLSSPPPLLLSSSPLLLLSSSPPPPLLLSSSSPLLLSAVLLGGVGCGVT